MRGLSESFAYGATSTAIVTVAGVDDFLLKLITSVIIAVVAATVSHYVKHGLARRMWSKKAKELHARAKKPPPH
jgi:hypothetical protein